MPPRDISEKANRTVWPPEPEEVGPPFDFFASGADSFYVTGEVLTLLGGETKAG